MKYKVIVLFISVISCGIFLFASYSYICWTICNHFYITDARSATLKIYPFEEEGKLVLVIPEYWTKDSLIGYWGDDQCDVNISGSELNMTFFRFIDIGISICYTSLDILCVNTQSGSIEDINDSKKKKKKEQARIISYKANGEFDNSFICKSIGGRGNSTWARPWKKPYDLNVGRSVSILGMHIGDKFCLLSNNYDRSNYRNYISLWLAQKLKFENDVDFRLVSLYLNGQYNGVYLITNDIEISKSNINIRIADDYDITGGYLLEYKYSDNNSYGFVSAHGDYFRIKTPKFFTLREKQYIEGAYNRAEKAIKDDHNIDSYLDVESFAKHYLLQEILFNADIGNIYIYKKPDNEGGLFYASTIWDFDSSLAKYEGELYNYPNLFIYKNGVDNDSYKGIWGELCESELFRNTVDSLFVNILKPALDNFIASGEMDSIKVLVEKENTLDYKKYPKELLHNNIDVINKFLIERVAFFHEEWNNNSEKSVLLAHTKMIRRPNYIVEFRCEKNNFFLIPQIGGIRFRGWYDSKGKNADKILVDADSVHVYGKWWEIAKWINR